MNFRDYRTMNFFSSPERNQTSILVSHWLSLFPSFLLGVKSNEGQPFEQTIPGYGTVYHVGNAEDVLKLLQNENGLTWTAHPQ